MSRAVVPAGPATGALRTRSGGIVGYALAAVLVVGAGLFLDVQVAGRPVDLRIPVAVTVAGIGAALAAWAVGTRVSRRNVAPATQVFAPAAAGTAWAAAVAAVTGASLSDAAGALDAAAVTVGMLTFYLPWLPWLPFIFAVLAVAARIARR